MGVSPRLSLHNHSCTDQVDYVLKDRLQIIVLFHHEEPGGTFLSTLLFERVSS